MQALLYWTRYKVGDTGISVAPVAPVAPAVLAGMCIEGETSCTIMVAYS